MQLRVLLLLALVAGAALALEEDYEYGYDASSSSFAPEPSSSHEPEPTSSAAPEPSSSAPPEPTSSPAPEPSPSPSPAPPSPPPKSTHNHTLYTDCVRVDFDVLAVIDGYGRALNVSNATAAATSVTGGCSFITNPKNTTFNLHKATIVGTLQVNSSTIAITFSFIENAFYTKDNVYISGDRSVFLQSISTTTTIADKVRVDSFTLGSTNWQVGANSSFNCNYYFNFTASASANAAAVASLQIGNVQAQAFLPEDVSAFSPTDANSVNCPAIIKLKTNKVGLIIGGIIAALSVFGIFSFACSKCKNGSRNGYRSLNDSV